MRQNVPPFPAGSHQSLPKCSNPIINCLIPRLKQILACRSGPTHPARGSPLRSNPFGCLWLPDPAEASRFMFYFGDYPVVPVQAVKKHQDICGVTRFFFFQSVQNPEKGDSAVPSSNPSLTSHPYPSTVLCLTSTRPNPSTGTRSLPQPTPVVPGPVICSSPNGAIRYVANAAYHGHVKCYAFPFGSRGLGGSLCDLRKKAVLHSCGCK